MILLLLDLAEVLLLSHALQQVVGLTTATVQQATLGLLQYARERQLLRGPSTGKQYVRCDKVLTELFGGADKVKFKKIRLMILRVSGLYYSNRPMSWEAFVLMCCSTVWG
ncbi:hypothetical protein EON65_29710 [archaeon]|nr:MAG: hypothetical protein EON65_29710 [archaeon]